VRRAGAGITLVEVLIAAVILLVALFPVLGLFLGQNKQASQATYLLEAHNHLMEMLSTIESRMYAQRFKIEELRDLSCTTEVEWGPKPIPVEEVVSQYRSTLTTGLWRVDCLVRWQESRGSVMVPRELRMSRLVAEPVE